MAENGKDSGQSAIVPDAGEEREAALLQGNQQ
jgi:hypothetical protein